MTKRILYSILTIGILGFAGKSLSNPIQLLDEVENSTHDAAYISKKFGKNARVVAKGKMRKSKSFSVTEGKSIQIDVLGETLELNVIKVSKKGGYRTAYTSRNKNNTRFLNMAMNDGKVVGSMMIDGKLYKIRPDEDTENTIIIEIPSEDLKDHDDNYTEDFNTPDQAQDNYNSYSNPSVTSASAGSEITVIVAYTQAFQNAAGDVNAYMDLLELETNTSFENSQVQAHVNIVYSYKTNYTDTGNFYTDRAYFSNSSNTYSTQLRELRDSRNADVMIVLTGPNYNFCGIANQIGSNEATAIAFASETCATGYFSFAHEIGHLMGARHIISQDPSSTPYAYGHGYCSGSDWRTVMAYNCPSSGGPRIQQWSNPYVSVEGKVTGTGNLEYNAKVWNARASTVSQFRNGTPNDILTGHGTTSSVFVNNKWGYKVRLWAESYYADVEATADQYCDYLGYTHAVSYENNYCGEDEDDFMRFNPVTFAWESKESGSKNRCYKMISSVNCQH